ncbi:MAG: zinc ribbon domain-containing protein [Candidatus Bathyarchaeia archaeon]
MVPPVVGQDGGALDNIIWILLPLLCCIMSMSQRGGDRQPSRETATESWYTIQDMEATFSEIEEETAEWRRQAEERRQETSGSITSKLRGVLGGRRDEERYVVKETTPPRLYRMDDSTGPIFFELTEVEGGGTVVKTTYSQAIKSRMAKLKARLPLKIPATPIGKRCPACGKPVLPEFSLCPYCGEKLMTE